MRDKQCNKDINTININWLKVNFCKCYRKSKSLQTNLTDEDIGASVKTLLLHMVHMNASPPLVCLANWRINPKWKASSKKWKSYYPSCMLLLRSNACTNTFTIKERISSLSFSKFKMMNIYFLNRHKWTI